MLATSRTRLLLPYERVYVVPGLSVVGGGGDAVDLFAARVAAATGDAAPPDAARVAALCRALDGMALAIELAAARFPALGLDGLESGLDQRLRFLTAGTAGSRPARLAARGHRLELRPALAPTIGRCCAASRCSPRGSTSTRPAPSREPAASGPRSPTGWPAWPSTACSSSSAASRPGTGRWRRSASTASSGWTRPVSWTRSGPATSGGAGWLVAALRRTESADIDEAWCARFDRIVDDVGAALAWSAGDETRRAQAAELAAELAGLLFLRGRPAQAQRRYEQAAELAATVDRAGGRPAAGRRRGRQPLRRRRRAAAVPDGGRRRRVGRRPGRCRAGSGDDGDVHQPRTGDHGHAALASGSRRVGRRSPSPVRRLAACPGGDRGGDGVGRRCPLSATRDESSSSPSGPATESLHSIALDLLTAANLVDDDIAEAVRIARRRLELLDTLAVGPLSGFEFGDGHLMAAEVDLAAGDLAGAAAHAEALAGLPFYRDEDHLATCPGACSSTRWPATSTTWSEPESASAPAGSARDDRSRRTWPGRPTPSRWCTACAATTTAGRPGCA